jgi:alpha-L-rhamnosidase
MIVKVPFACKCSLIVSVLAATVLSGCLSFVGAKSGHDAGGGSPFVAAERVWPEGLAKHLNMEVKFVSRFKLDETAKPFLRITGSTVYRIWLNGVHIGYGPARGPRNWYRVDEWPLSPGMKNGDNTLEIEVVGYNADSYQYCCQPSFLQAEVVSAGKIIAATSAKGNSFVAEQSSRLRKITRYSLQRTFAESYRLDKKAKKRKYKLERRDAGVYRYIGRIAPYPDFRLNRSVKVLSRSDVRLDGEMKVKPFQFTGVRGDLPWRRGFRADELESDMWRTLNSLVFSGRKPAGDLSFAKGFALAGGESVMIDAGLNDCGFAAMIVNVKKPGKLFLNFDEVLVDGKIDPARVSCVNALEWEFVTPGVYKVESIEPYVWRYGNLSALSGEFEVSDFFIRTYKNSTTGRASFSCSDPALTKIFEAARETFVQNAVDVYTDCPGRERAGWLCDSFFIARVNRLLCGDSDLERLYLQNYALPEAFETLPEGVLPMCYPSDHGNENFIPNWVMWLVIQAEEYLARTGDREMIDALRPRFEAFLKYMDGFRNEDGLLENLPKWVFVEWSRANRLVQDVNYPSNMTWAEVLDVMDRLYGMSERAKEAERIRETVRRQSWTGKWFCDNAVRQKDGTLKLSGECTETCQYYAFFFRTATPETHPELWRTLVDDFGPGRIKTGKHPEVHPSNAFIGNYLRLECLSREGRADKIHSETKDFFLYMAERTGTLWEMISPTASCDHGFASHAAVYLMRDILGVKKIDAKKREAVVEVPGNVPLRWCEGVLPVSKDEAVRVKWVRGGETEIEWLKSDGCEKASRAVKAPAYDTFISHRGESYDAPENTMSAFRMAVDRGFGFECDLYLSKDKRVFSFHDKNLKRTTGVDLKCSEASWVDTLSKIDAGAWKGDRWKGERPALLEEILPLARNGRKIYVEIKSGPEIVPYIKEIFAKQKIATPENALFICFDPEVCAKLNELMGEYKVYWLCTAWFQDEKKRPLVPRSPASIIEKLREIGADGVDINFDKRIVDSDFVAEINAAGYELHVWTVDQLDDALLAFARGALTVTTNCSKKLLEEYRER